MSSVGRSGGIPLRDPGAPEEARKEQPRADESCAREKLGDVGVRAWRAGAFEYLAQPRLDRVLRLPEHAPAFAPSGKEQGVPGVGAAVSGHDERSAGTQPTRDLAQD